MSNIRNIASGIITTRAWVIKYEWCNFQYENLFPENLYYLNRNDTKWVSLSIFIFDGVNYDIIDNPQFKKDLWYSNW